MAEGTLNKEDVVGIVAFDYPKISREEFFKLASEVVTKVAKSEDEAVKDYFKDSKAYIIGRQGGTDYYQVFFIKKDTETFKTFESLQGRKDYILKS